MATALEHIEDRVEDLTRTMQSLVSATFGGREVRPK